MNIITKYYNYACYLLKDILPYIPVLKLTNAKRYCGQLDTRGNYPIIRISKWNHVDALWLMDIQDRDEIIDTICHELAHTIVSGHNERHERATKLFMTIVLNNLKLLELDGGVAV
jgi:hypothetical protein